LGWITYRREIVSRNQNRRQSIGQAARIFALNAEDKLRGVSYPFAKNKKPDHTKMCMPSTAPKWLQIFRDNNDIIGFWETLEKEEDEYLENRWRRKTKEEIFLKKEKAVVYFREILGLPKEMSQETGLVFIDEFVRTVYVERGIYVQYAVYFDPENSHVRLMGSIRSINQQAVSTRHKDFGSSFFQQRDLLLYARKTYADLGNKYLQKEGHEPRLDHRSYKEQGIEKAPQKRRKKGG